MIPEKSFKTIMHVPRFPFGSLETWKARVFHYDSHNISSLKCILDLHYSTNSIFFGTKIFYRCIFWWGCMKGHLKSSLAADNSQYS